MQTARPAQETLPAVRHHLWKQRILTTIGNFPIDQKELRTDSFTPNSVEKDALDLSLILTKEEKKVAEL